VVGLNPIVTSMLWKAPLKGEARDRVRTSEGINPPSFGTMPDIHVLKTVNLGLTIVEEPGVTCW